MIHSSAPKHGAQGVSRSRGTSWETERAARSLQLAQQQFMRPEQGQEQQWPNPWSKYKSSPLGGASSQGVQTGHGTSARSQLSSLCSSLCTGRAVKLCQQTGEQWYPPSRKPRPLLSLVPTTTDAAAQTEIQWEHAAAQGVRLQSVPCSYTSTRC